MILRGYVKAFCFLGLGLISSCVVGPQYSRPQVNTPKTLADQKDLSTQGTPETTFGAAQHFNPQQEIPAQWWKIFHSKALNALILASFQHNPDIGAAKASLRAAKEEILAFQGIYFPFIGFSGIPSKQQTAKILTSILASNQYDYALYTGQLYLTYNPDVFGGNRRHEESLIAQANYQQLQLQATYLSLAANVVNAAIQEAALREQIQTTKDIIHNEEKRLLLTQSRYKFGDASEVDIATEEATLAAAKATLPILKKQLIMQRNLLNALTGRLPHDKHTPEFSFSSLQLPKDLPLSIPSTLLEHRPDIRAAEEQMKSANALIGVAVANRLPNFNFGFTNAGTTTANLNMIFSGDTLFWSLAGIITQPIYDAGTRLHHQRAAEAYYHQAANLYRSTVIHAFQNVADTLAAIRQDAVELQTADAAARAALKTLNISRKQWRAGDINIFTLSTYQQRYRQAQMNLIQSQASRLSDTVALYQSLGGSWWSDQLQ